MNESANDQGSVTGKAVGTVLGIGTGIALTGIGLFAGGKVIGGAGRAIKNTAKGIVNGAKDTISTAQSAYRHKKYDCMFGQLDDLAKTALDDLAKATSKSKKATSKSKGEPILKTSRAFDNPKKSML